MIRFSASHFTFALTLSCQNRPGIVAMISARLYELGANITEAQQFDYIDAHQFFMRIVFDVAHSDSITRQLEQTLTEAASHLEMTWSLTDMGKPHKTLLLVSKFDHCLVDLLYRWRIGELPIDPVGIIANHPADTYANTDFYGIPFHYLPITKNTKAAQEEQIWKIFQDSGAELIVLARYMQILSNEFSQKLSGRCINIHHSFLPGFKGARPYHQAFARGVKLIGATAHYVTSDLDEGPIIEQDVERISHADSPEDLIRKGRDIERRVLASAVRCHIERRTILNGSKTIIFRD